MQIENKLTFLPALRRTSVWSIACRAYWGDIQFLVESWSVAPSVVMTMVPDADQKKKSLYESRETINSLPVSIFYFDEELLWVALPLFLDSKCLPAFVFWGWNYCSLSVTFVSTLKLDRISLKLTVKKQIKSSKSDRC